MDNMVVCEQCYQAKYENHLGPPAHENLRSRDMDASLAALVLDAPGKARMAYGSQ